MKKTLLLLLPLLLISCDSDKSALHEISTHETPKTDFLSVPAGFLSVPTFSKSKPKYKKKKHWQCFDSVKFETNGIEGLTQTQHNVFRANEAKDYELKISIGGKVYFQSPYNDNNCSVLIKATKQEYDSYSSSGGLESIYHKRVHLEKDDYISFRFSSAEGGKVSEIKDGFVKIEFLELHTK